MNIGILLLRITVGFTMVAHGFQKFGWFDGPGLEKTGQEMAMLGFHPGRRYALQAAVVEVSSGVLIALGLFTPLASAFVASMMFVAGVSAHGNKGFFLPGGGCEYTFVLGMAGLSPAFIGPGSFSVDALLGIAMYGVRYGLAAGLVALVGGTIQLAQRSASSTRSITAGEPV
jgi:putative oxidoreductase